MKNIKIKLLIVTILCSILSISAENEKKYSIELNANYGLNSFTSLDDIDVQLEKLGYPSLAGNLDFCENVGSSFIFRIKRWGIMVGYHSYGLSTAVNSNGKYYDGVVKSSLIGVSYDAVKAKWFILTPYINFGIQNLEMYLDSKLDGYVTPTSLAIKANEPNVNIGTLLYFRVGNWYDERLQLFINAEMAYKFSLEGEWRFDNKLIDSSDFNLSHLNTGAGLSLRYSF